MKNGNCALIALAVLMAQAAPSIAATVDFPVRDTGAQAYPVKPIRLVVGFSPGGSADVTARIVAARLGSRWGSR